MIKTFFMPLKYLKLDMFLIHKLGMLITEEVYSNYYIHFNVFFIKINKVLLNKKKNVN